MSSIPIVLFGAFDRHNLGDFLLGHAAAMEVAPQPYLFAGLRATNFSAQGGFQVECLEDVLARWSYRFGPSPMKLVHVGGEVLDTDAWEATVMLLDPREAPAVIARLDRNAIGRCSWAARFLGTGRPAPYVLGREGLPPGSWLEFRAVGGVGLGRRDGGFIAALARALGSADKVTVRDHRTRQALAAMGVNAELEPDPATTLADWLMDLGPGAPSIPGDYVAFQCAAAFGDDDSLDALAVGLNRLGLPVVAFRAGAAPWHDDLGVYERLSGRLRVPATILPSLHVREICASIANARLCLASSLHVLLVAGVCGVPATGLERRAGEGEKLRAYAETWGGFQIRTADQI